MHGRALLILLAAILLAGGVPAAVPSPVHAAGCPTNRPLTMDQLWQLWRADAQPGDGGGSGSYAAMRRCYGSETFSVRGFVGRIDGLGGTSASGVGPGYWEWPDLYLFSTSRLDKYGYNTAGHSISLVTFGKWGVEQERYQDSWVIVTVRFNHPQATECRGYGPKAIRPTRKEAIAFCKGRPVVTSVTRVPAMPATDARPDLRTGIGNAHPVPLSV